VNECIVKGQRGGGCGGGSKDVVVVMMMMEVEVEEEGKEDSLAGKESGKRKR